MQGTPLQNSLLELFALLHFIDPQEFSDPKSEAESFSAIESCYSETKVAQIHELLKPRCLCCLWQFFFMLSSFLKFYQLFDWDYEVVFYTEIQDAKKNEI